MAVRSFGCAIGLQQNSSFFDRIIIKKLPHEIKGFGGRVEQGFFEGRL
jgi:hypothetical protein